MNEVIRMSLSKFFHQSYMKKQSISSDTTEENSKAYDDFLKKLTLHKVDYVVRDSENFPSSLYNIDDCPEVLFYKGDLESVTKSKCVAIVGTRHPSSYGMKVAFDLSEYLSRNGVTVVSGLADGIDTAVHKGTLKAKGRTAAVMATGPLKTYPKHNTILSNEIVDTGGVILSEKPLDESARRYDFPFRNRIISGLADSVVIIEASHKSGSMITAKYAVQQGKNVFSLPGNIYAEVHQGTNQLIYDGATPLINFEDVLLSLQLRPIENEINRKIDVFLTDFEHEVLHYIKKYNIIEIDFLVKLMKVPIEDVNSAVSKFLIEDICRYNSLTSVQYIG